MIRSALRRAPQIVLQELLHDVTDRIVVAVTFLALLELAKGREVTIEQDEPWGPITVTQLGRRPTREVAVRWMTASSRSRFDDDPTLSTRSTLPATLTRGPARGAALRRRATAHTARDRGAGRRRSRDRRRAAGRSRGHRCAIAACALVAAGDEVQLVTAPEAGSLIARYIGAEGARLSPAALETLAIVAYRQPVTRGVIERIRGVDSDYVLRTLLHRRLVVEQGRADTPGRPILYGTGFDFLERFGLTSLDDLPPLDAEAAERLVE